MNKGGDLLFSTSIFTNLEKTTDFIPRKDKQAKQLGQLNNIVSFANEQSRFYQELYQNVNVNVSNLREYEEIPMISSRDIMKEIPPKHMLTSSPHNSYVFTSGGTTGEPKLIYLTADELKENIFFHGKGYAMAGINKSDTVATFGVPGFLTSEFTVYLGLERTGCTIVPIGMSSDLERLSRYIKMFNVTTLLVMPSDVIPLAQYIEKNKSQLSINRIVYGGEKMYSSTKNYLESALGVKDFKSVFQSMDVGTIGFQCDYCEAGTYHIHDQLQYIEILNEQGQPVQDGEVGELVITNLKRKLMPVIRYQTNDLVLKIDSLCPCGRTNQRIKLIGRKGEIIKLGGEQIFPQIFAQACSHLDELTGEFQLVVKKQANRDMIHVFFEVSGKAMDKEIEANLINRIRERVLTFTPKLKQMIQLQVIAPLVISLVNRDNLKVSESSGKIVRVIDQRK